MRKFYLSSLDRLEELSSITNQINCKPPISLLTKIIQSCDKNTVNDSIDMNNN